MLMIPMTDCTAQFCAVMRCGNVNDIDNLAGSQLRYYQKEVLDGAENSKRIVTPDNKSAGFIDYK